MCWLTELHGDLRLVDPIRASLLILGRVDILSSPSMASRPYRAPSLTAVFTHCNQATPLLKHLFYEARLLTMLETLTATFRRVRQTVAHDPTQLRTLWAAMSEHWLAADRWRTEVISEKSRSLCVLRTGMTFL